MNSFRYQAIEANGTAVKGVIEAEDRKGALQLLGKRGLFASSLEICSSDPLCAETTPEQAFMSLHGAACHNCLFLPETSCERGNRYLDRSVLVPTMERAEFAFLRP